MIASIINNTKYYYCCTTVVELYVLLYCCDGIAFVCRMKVDTNIILNTY